MAFEIGLVLPSVTADSEARLESSMVQKVVCPEQGSGVLSSFLLYSFMVICKKETGPAS